MRSWLMKITIVRDLLIEPVSLRRLCDIRRACRPSWLSPISPSISARGTSAATESTTSTSIAFERTNVSVMQRYDELSPASRQRLLADVESETRELTALVNELVELATDRRDLEVPVTIVVGPVAEGVAETAFERLDDHARLARGRRLHLHDSGLQEFAD